MASVGPFLTRDEPTARPSSASRPAGVASVRRAMTAAAAVLLSWLRPRRADIHVADISDEWLADHHTETPKHADDR